MDAKVRVPVEGVEETFRPHRVHPAGGDPQGDDPHSMPLPWPQHRVASGRDGPPPRVQADGKKRESRPHGGL